ncbi:hypothetical protein HAX54_049443, partial [Datura stramonium]|nr:hypothetical protein [Datura stramonium]
MVGGPADLGGSGEEGVRRLLVLVFVVLFGEREWEVRPVRVGGFPAMGRMEMERVRRPFWERRENNGGSVGVDRRIKDDGRLGLDSRIDGSGRGLIGSPDGLL